MVKLVGCLITLVLCTASIEDEGISLLQTTASKHKLSVHRGRGNKECKSAKKARKEKKAELKQVKIDTKAAKQALKDLKARRVELDSELKLADAAVEAECPVDPNRGAMLEYTTAAVCGEGWTHARLGYEKTDCGGAYNMYEGMEGKPSDTFQVPHPKGEEFRDACWDMIGGHIENGTACGATKPPYERYHYNFGFPGVVTARSQGRKQYADGIRSTQDTCFYSQKYYKGKLDQQKPFELYHDQNAMTWSCVVDPKDAKNVKVWKHMSPRPCNGGSGWQPGKYSMSLTGAYATIWDPSKSPIPFRSDKETRTSPVRTAEDRLRIWGSELKYLGLLGKFKSSDRKKDLQDCYDAFAAAKQSGTGRCARAEAVFWENNQNAWGGGFLSGGGCWCTIMSRERPDDPYIVNHELLQDKLEDVTEFSCTWDEVELPLKDFPYNSVHV